jgi:hypothetical protein
MIKLEKIIGITALVGLILKYLLLISGGGILITLSLVILADLYFLFGFALFNQIEFKQIFKSDSYKEITKEQIIGSIGVGIALSMIFVGALFKFSHWPDSLVLLIIGTLISLVAAIVFLIKYFKSKQNYYIRVLKRIAIIGTLGLILMCISDLTLARIQLRNNVDYVKAYGEYQKDPQNIELRKKMNLEYYKATVSKEEYELYLERTKNQ